MACKAYYDPRIEELAIYFLREVPGCSSADAIELASTIQLAIEDWWGNRRPVYRLAGPQSAGAGEFLEITRGIY